MCLALLVVLATEIVVVGSGVRLEKPVAKELVEMLRAKGVAVEQMDTVSAVA
jgi:uncharacterized protein